MNTNVSFKYTPFTIKVTITLDLHCGSIVNTRRNDHIYCPLSLCFTIAATYSTKVSDFPAISPTLSTCRNLIIVKHYAAWVKDKNTKAETNGNTCVSLTATLETTCDITPKGVFWVFITPPVPPQLLQGCMQLLDLAPVPWQFSHASEQEISISLCTPKTDSSKLKCRSYLRGKKKKTAK